MTDALWAIVTGGVGISGMGLGILMSFDRPDNVRERASIDGDMGELISFVVGLPLGGCLKDFGGVV